MRPLAHTELSPYRLLSNTQMYTATTKPSMMNEIEQNCYETEPKLKNNGLYQKFCSIP
jgi:hypothetical protein